MLRVMGKGQSCSASDALLEVVTEAEKGKEGVKVYNVQAAQLL